MDDRQWGFIEECLKAPGLRAVVVCTEKPVVDWTPAQAQALFRHPRTEFVREHWSYHAEEQGRLLRLLFEWKAKGPRRECLLLCGGTRSGVDTALTATAPQPTQPRI